MNNIYKDLPKPFFALAPLDDVTDVVFREVVASCAKPDLFFTEFVNVDGLQSPGRQRIIHRLLTSKSDKPIIAQIWGKNPENYQKTASELVDMGFAGVDINMGCPIRAVVNNGCCVALINNRPLTKDIIAATKAGLAGRIPISVKTRLGFNEVDFTWHEFLLEQGIDSLTVHGRTKKELSLVPADWAAIGKVVKIKNKISPETTIIGNGDVMSLDEGIKLAAQHKVDGIMIGRGIFSDPYVFSKNSPWQSATEKEKIELFIKHVKLFDKTWSNNERSHNTLKRFAKIYINNFDGAKELRERLMASDSVKEILSILE